MEQKGKDARRGKQQVRSHGRNPQQATSGAEPTVTVLLPPEPLYAWREKDGEVRIGTEHELNERHRAGATVTQVNPTGTTRPGGAVVTGRAMPTTPAIEAICLVGQAVEQMAGRAAVEARSSGKTLLIERFARDFVANVRGVGQPSAGKRARRDFQGAWRVFAPQGDEHEAPLRYWIEVGDRRGEVRTGSDRLLRARQRAGVVEAVLEGAGEPRRGRAVAAAVGEESVSVPADLLKAARERTGIEDPAELVAFALSLVAEQGSGEEAFNAALGSLPGHTLETF